MLGITSTFIPDIIDAMPDNSTFTSNVQIGISNNAQNKLPYDSGVITIEKTLGNYSRVIFNRCNSGVSYPHLYLANVNMQNKTVSGWYDFSGANV